ncbi:UNVERIFIED_CONTAM: hypothetical protein Sangu_0454200 [Sesamum angustifolium]|uniref:PRKR-interacting protein 1 n=1 Tax=Sesamum angustifolium TaxID=2727405 RepID=A0AAW2QTT1_9LAMI
MFYDSGDGCYKLSRIQTLGISVSHAKIVDVILVGKGDVGRRGRLAGGFSGGQVSCRSPPRPPPPSSSSSTALVEYKPPAANPEDEDLEIKLRRIIECVPVRVSNTSGSSAGSGSGDFHQYRQMRRKEQDRLARMDADYQKKEIAEFNQRREERLKAAEERTAKKRSKRLKKKQRKKVKKSKPSTGGDEHQKEQSSDEDGDSDNEET